MPETELKLALASKDLPREALGRRTLGSREKSRSNPGAPRVQARPPADVIALSRQPDPTRPLFGSRSTLIQPADADRRPYRP
jgi:hypothetical protein